MCRNAFNSWTEEALVSTSIIKKMNMQCKKGPKVKFVINGLRFNKCQITRETFFKCLKYAN